MANGRHFENCKLISYLVKLSCISCPKPHPEWSSRVGSEPSHVDSCLCMALPTPNSACQERRRKVRLADKVVADWIWLSTCRAVQLSHSWVDRTSFLNLSLCLNLGSCCCMADGQLLLLHHFSTVCSHLGGGQILNDILLYKLSSCHHLLSCCTSISVFQLSTLCRLIHLTHSIKMLLVYLVGCILFTLQNSAEMWHSTKSVCIWLYWGKAEDNEMQADSNKETAQEACVSEAYNWHGRYRGSRRRSG